MATSPHTFDSARLRVVAGLLLLVGLLVASPPPAQAASSITYDSTWGVRGVGPGDLSFDWRVSDLAHVGNRQFAAGRFTQVVAPDGSTRDQSYLAAFNRTTGVWENGFRPDINGPVYAIETSADGSVLFIGGEFTTVNGVTTGPLAAVNPSTGAVITSFSASVAASSAGRRIILALETDGSQLYVGGDFSSINGDGQRYLARLSAASGAVDAGFTPDLAGGLVMAVEASRDGRVFVGGQFKNADDDTDHAFFVGLDNNGRVFSQEKFDQRIIFETPIVFDILEAGDKIYIASQSNLLTIVDQQTLAKLRTFGPDVANEDAPDWFRSSDFQALIQANGAVYAGNHTRWLGQPTPNFPNGHIDSKTGELIATNLISKHAPSGNQINDYLPSQLDGGVWALDDAGSGCLWVGGNLRVDGRSDWNLGRVCETDINPNGCTRLLTGQFAGISGGNAQVARLYVAVFGRQPDAGGFQFWVNERSNGRTLDNMATFFVQSPEFVATYGENTSDTQFIELLYQNIFCRSADTAGLNHWRNQLGSGTSRARVLLFLTESAEFKTATGTS